MKPEIDLIIFDLGNVLVRFDTLTGLSRLVGQVQDAEGKPCDVQAIQALTLAPEDGKSMWTEAGCGRMDDEAVVDIVNKRLGAHIPKESVKDALSNIFELMPERQAILHNLIEQGKNVALLSDTWKQDEQFINNAFPDLLGPLPEERKFYSYAIGTMKKLGSDAYQHVADKMGVDPAKVLMIDDKLENRIGTDAIGMHFAHVLPDDDLETILKRDWGICLDEPMDAAPVQNPGQNPGQKNMVQPSRNDPHNGSTPVILYRHNKEGEKEVALIIQDNAPLWRVFGNGFEIPPDDESRRDMYRKNILRVLKDETNLPIKLREKVEPLYKLKWRDEASDTLLESNRVFAIDVGDFPLESKKGAFIDFFPADKLPPNMSSGHDILVHEAIAVLNKAHKPKQEKLVVHDLPPSRLQKLDEMITNGDKIVGLEEWHQHPSVVAKREANKLTRDPALR